MYAIAYSGISTGYHHPGYVSSKIVILIRSITNIVKPNIFSTIRFSLNVHLAVSMCQAH